MAGLRVGDKVIAVNDVSTVDVDHYDAVEVLKQCGRVLILVIVREVTRIVPPSEQVSGLDLPLAVTPLYNVAILLNALHACS